MKANDYQKQAEAESLKVLGEVSKDFVIGYLSMAIQLLDDKVSDYDRGFDEGFQTAQLAENGIKALESGADSLFDSVKIICDKYNKTILK